MKDKNTNSTKDQDSDQLTFTCFYDQNIDKSVANLKKCSDIKGVSYDTFKGTFNWTPKSGQMGFYEFKISASDGGLVDTQYFSKSS